ncbi:MAG: hypothetical protein H7247_07875 [Polaromonas sp.]|nr:hypothetical protein [Gemmatimonadaceae bacterium]
MTGSEADQVRQAESRRRGGDPATAIRLLEDALEASLLITPVLPGWLCGRLAALYRTIGRHDDEVLLLERFRDSQEVEEARTRYNARLSKARTIAERKRRSDSGALDSVRALMSRPDARRTAVPHLEFAEPNVTFSAGVLSALTAALSRAGGGGTQALDAALAQLCEEARANDLPVEAMVSGLKKAYDAVTDARPLAARDVHYDSALLVLLSLYFNEQAA